MRMRVFLQTRDRAAPPSAPDFWSLHTRMEFSLYLLVSLLCLYLHPWHIHVEAEMSRGNRLGTQQSEQAMLIFEAKQLYVDGIKVISLLQIQ